jgi:hypothetical protein
MDTTMDRLLACLRRIFLRILRLPACPCCTACPTPPAPEPTPPPVFEEPEAEPEPEPEAEPEPGPEVEPEPGPVRPPDLCLIPPPEPEPEPGPHVVVQEPGDPPVQEPAEEPAREEPLLGLNIQPASGHVSLQHVLALGIRHVRVSLREEETIERDWGWHALYRAAGVEVLPMVAHPHGLRDFRPRLDYLLSAIGHVTAVQLGNEYDDEVWANTAGGRAVGRMVRQAALWLHERGIRAVAPGLGWTQPGVHDYYRAMLDECGDLIDVVALHTYGDHAWGEPLSRCEHLRAAGWTGPIWNTEMGQRGPDSRAFLRGYTGREPTREDVLRWQREVWERVLTEDPSRFGYERIYGFQLAPDDRHDGSIYCGIVEPGWTPRPTYEWLRTETRIRR